VFVLVCLGLGWLGSKPAEDGYVIAARVLTAYYFIYFLIIFPLLGLIETPKLGVTSTPEPGRNPKVFCICADRAYVPVLTLEQQREHGTKRKRQNRNDEREIGSHLQPRIVVQNRKGR
jgi:hypothetical protein